MRTPSLWMALFLFSLSACNGNGKDGSGHEHGAGELEPTAITQYTDRTELFVEFKPLVVGQVSNFATHLTVLGERFNSLDSAEVTVSLIVGEKGIRNTAKAPSSPGIFRLSLQPVVAGKGQLVFDIKAKSFQDRHVLENIQVFADQAAAMKVPHEHGNEGAISYLKEQAWKTDFANEAVKRGTAYEVIHTHGQILPAPGDEMVISAGASGIVRFATDELLEGSAVGAGARLFTISGGNIAERNLDATYKEAKTNFERAKAEFERSSELAKSNIISQKELLQAKTSFENAQTTFLSLSRNYTGGGQSVNSPIGGFLKAVYVREGQFVEAGTPLAVVSQNKKLILQANLSQKHFGKVGSTLSANFRTTASDRFFSTDSLHGRVISFGKSTSDEMPFIPVMFEVDNLGTILPGTSADIFLKTTPLPNVLTIAESALMEEQGTYFVYVQTGGEQFEKRQVSIGASDGIRVQILRGLQEGERVVTQGAYAIKLAAASGKMPAHGHEH